jgi:hypothetical protein
MLARGNEDLWEILVAAYGSRTSFFRLSIMLALTLLPGQ